LSRSRAVEILSPNDRPAGIIDQFRFHDRYGVEVIPLDGRDDGMNRIPRLVKLWLVITGVAAVAAAVAVLRISLPPVRPLAPAGPIHLRDVSAETGIAFLHTDGSSGRRYIVEAMSAGVATFDFDGDGLIDIYFLNGAPLRGADFDPAAPPINRLYRNNGDWTFTEVTGLAGLADAGFGLGVAVADYNNDGFPDLYLNNHGPNVLYRNNGDGTFTDVTDQAGVGNGDQVGAGAAFLDIDSNGNLDLYATNYLVFDYSMHVQRSIDGIPSYPSPKDFQPVPDTLFRNNGDGTFTDISVGSGIGLHAGTGMGMVCADYDNSGHTDIFVCNDVAENFFFRNDGTGKFEEVGLLIGVAYNFYGDENASMGVDCADYDNDGLLDFFMTSYQSELPVLYRNLGNGMLEDVTLRTDAGTGTLPHVNWGIGLIDFDNDGDRDVFIANGHTEDNAELRDRSTAWRARNTLLLNTLIETGEARFVDVSNQAGDGLLPVRASRGAAFDDLDNDGRIDAVILNIRDQPTILRNESANGHLWLQIQLRGTRSNRDGVGSRVTVTAGDLVQTAEVHSGRGYQGHFGSRLHFGLGAHDHVDRIEIRWHGGDTQVVENLPVNRLHTFIEPVR
jgi:enediyne biosynthesis protein E4